MAYQSLYRRYRPRRFSDVRGQEPVVRALRNAVRDNRVGHAYLFSGPTSGPTYPHGPCTGEADA